MKRTTRKSSSKNSNIRKLKEAKKNGKHDRAPRASYVSEPIAEYKVDVKARHSNTVDESWDFRKSNTKEYTHCFHPYPAMMIPQVARRIIENYGGKSRMLFDPYCGTGTSLVEANLKGINAIGTDINPLARLIASAKTTEVDIQVLDLFLQDFANYFFSLNFQIGKEQFTS